MSGHFYGGVPIEQVDFEKEFDKELETLTSHINKLKERKYTNKKINFHFWAMNNGYSDELTIERKDNDKGYSPENCTWVTKSMQYKNKRQNIMITYNGMTLCAEDWAKETGIPATTIRWRFKREWDVERIFQKPLPAPYKPKGDL